MAAELSTKAEALADQARELSGFKNLSLPGVKEQVAEILALIGRNGIFSTYPPAEWEYTQSNIAAAAGHYTEVAYRLGQLATQSPEKRIETVQRWLESAVFWANNLKKIGIAPSPQTELTHQSVWLGAFENWRSYAGL